MECSGQHTLSSLVLKGTCTVILKNECCSSTEKGEVFFFQMDVCLEEASSARRDEGSPSRFFYDEFW